MKAKIIMTQDVVVAHPDMSLHEAKDLLRRHNITGLPVVDDQRRVLGVLSCSDLVKKKGDRVRQLMTSPAITVDEDATVEEVAALMATNDVNQIPVLRQGRLVGIIARADIVRYVAARHAWLEIEPENGAGQQ